MHQRGSGSEQSGSFRGGADALVTAMQDIAGWGEVTLIVHTDDGIFETPARCRVAPSATVATI